MEGPGPSPRPPHHPFPGTGLGQQGQVAVLCIGQGHGGPQATERGPTVDRWPGRGHLGVSTPPHPADDTGLTAGARPGAPGPRSPSGPEHQPTPADGNGPDVNAGVRVREASGHLASLRGGWPPATVNVVPPKETTPTHKVTGSTEMHAHVSQIEVSSIFALRPNP